MSHYVGLAIGGQKCAVSSSTENASGFQMIHRVVIATPAAQLEASNTQAVWRSYSTV